MPNRSARRSTTRLRLVEVKRTGRIIKLLTVQGILDEEHVQKM
jgi:hypothetical protein